MSASTAAAGSSAGAGLVPAVGRDRALALCDAAAGAAEADRVEVSILARTASHTRFAQDRVHQPQELTEWTLVARCEVDGRSARASSTDLTAGPRLVREAAARARALARAAGRLPSSGTSTGRAPETEESSLWDEPTAAWDVGARVEQARAAMALAAADGGSAFGVLGRAASEMAVATSEGVRRYAAGTEALGALTVRVEDGSSHWVDLDRRVDVLDVTGAVRRTVAQARAARGRVALPTGRYDVVLGPLATGGLLESIGSFGFTGPAVADGVGAVATRRGERVAAHCVDVADDPHALRGLPFPFDVEGTAARRVPLLTGGVVADAVTDRVSALRSGLPATGHAHVAREETPAPVPSSVAMAPGGHDVEELVAGVERGVYVQRFWYLRVVDPTTTTITGGSRDACFLIEDGRLGRPLEGARFAEEVFGALDRVDAVGSDVLAQPVPNVWNGAVSAPAVRVRGFRLGMGPGRGEEEAA